MKIFVYALLISSLSFASLTGEKLSSIFITHDNIGPLSLEKLQSIERALHELGHFNFITSLKEKLNIDSLASLSKVVHVCDLPSSQKGYYQGSSSTTNTQMKSHQSDIYDMKFWDKKGLFNQTSDAYKVFVTDHKAYASLTTLEWPKICLRPNQSFAYIISTFVHEAVHLLGHDEQAIEEFLHYKNQNDYILKTLHKKGGELEAYIASTKIELDILNRFLEVLRPDPMMNFFDSKGELIDRAGLEYIILKELGYEEIFRTEYKELATSSLKRKEYQLELSHHYLAQYESELKNYKKRHAIYKKKNYSVGIKDTLNAITFYREVIDLTYSTIFQTELDIQNIRLRSH